jgi:hypothetical protein
VGNKPFKSPVNPEVHCHGRFRGYERDDPSCQRRDRACRRPGMPLSILSNIAREAPLSSLLVALLLGAAVVAANDAVC